MKYCNHEGCKRIIREKNRYCPIHIPEHRNDIPREKSYNRIYKSDRWQKYRRWYLGKYPNCIKCGKLARMVDHIIPVSQGGNFWESSNHQPLCITCHSKKTSQEDGGFGNKKRKTNGITRKKT